MAEYCPVSPASHPVPRLYLHQNDNHDDDDDVHDDHHHDYDIDNDDHDDHDNDDHGGASPVDAGADLGLEDVSSLSITTGLLYLTRENVVPAPDSSPMIVCSLVITIIFSNSPRNYINHIIVSRWCVPNSRNIAIVSNNRESLLIKLFFIFHVLSDITTQGTLEE